MLCCVLCEKENRKQISDARIIVEGNSLCYDHYKKWYKDQ